MSKSKGGMDNLSTAITLVVPTTTSSSSCGKIYKCIDSDDNHNSYSPSATSNARYKNDREAAGNGIRVGVPPVLIQPQIDQPLFRRLPPSTLLGTTSTTTKNQLQNQSLDKNFNLAADDSSTALALPASTISSSSSSFSRTSTPPKPITSPRERAQVCSLPSSPYLAPAILDQSKTTGQRKAKETAQEDDKGECNPPPPPQPQSLPPTSFTAAGPKKRTRSSGSPSRLKGRTLGKLFPKSSSMGNAPMCNASIVGIKSSIPAWSKARGQGKKTPSSCPVSRTES